MMRTIVAAVIVAVSVTGAVSAGPANACRTDEGAITIVTCAPAVSLSGAPIDDRGVEEDGSAGYADGSSFDAETGWY